MQIFYLSA